MPKVKSAQVKRGVRAATLDLDNKAPLDETDEKLHPVLGNLQGNILKGHGREHGVYIFFSFRDDIGAARQTLADLARRYVTSALRQHRETMDYRAFRVPGGLFGNLLITASGYRRLGLDPQSLFHEEPEGDIHSSFATGMKEHAVEDFADPPVESWDPGYRKDIDAMLLLADDDAGYLLREARRAMNDIAVHCTVRAAERGDALRNEDDEGIEHFGYVDGRSQPLYLRSDFEFDSRGRRVAESGGGGIRKWDPFEPLRRVLVPDPGAEDAPGCFGSFMVFRKLEQDVLHFKLREQELADALGFEGEERERAGALAVGRFEDGTPVTLSKTDGFRPAKENDFDYAADADGTRCPFHAHIRKANPRGDVVREFGAPEEAERSRRITRRGMPYGERNKHPSTFQAIEELPSKNVGLLFMCFQASIRAQFAFMQRDWCNAANFLRQDTGIDPVMGQPSSPPGVEQRWSSDYGSPANTSFRFENFVRMKGGEFFFAPSIPFLTGLA
ncbi:MAG TPA: Dyp-type peroxidase [Longimicrobium sp.]|jgi:Dyp-type peroxidase family